MRAVDEDPLDSGERRMAPAVRVFESLLQAPVTIFSSEMGTREVVCTK
jgi:hypothetical protein